MLWSPPHVADRNGIIDYFQIILKNSLSLEIVSNQATTDSRPSFLITSLQPSTDYSCSVAAVTVASGPFSSSINFTTDPDGTALYLWFDKRILIIIIIMFYIIVCMISKHHKRPRLF